MRSTNKFRILAAAAVAVTLLGVSACSSGGGGDPSSGASGDSDLPTSFNDDLVAKAKAEGELVIYMDGDERSVQTWSQAFTQKYGISVTTMRAGTAALSQQVEQEFAAGQHLHDIVITTDELSMQNWAKDGILGQYTPTDANLWPADLGVAGYYYPTQNTSIQTVAWNTEKVTPDEQAELMKDPLKAMTDPAFKGRIGLNNPDTSVTRVLSYYNYTDGPAKDLYGGWDLLDKIAANQPTVYGDVIALVQGLTIGEVDVVWGGVPDGYIAINVASGAPLAYSYPAKPSAITGFTGVASDAQHPYAARLFQEWAATPEAAALFSQTSQTYPLNSEVKDTRAVTQQPWYTPVSDVIDDEWVHWSSDEAFVAATDPNGPWVQRWNQLFGVTG